MDRAKKRFLRLHLITQNVPRLADVWLNCHLGRPPKYLPILLAFITDRCNLQCSMCGVWERYESDSGVEELSTKEWKAVIRSAVKLRTVLLSITGGEPLLRPDLFEIIRYARQRGIAVHLCSNGTMLNHQNVNQLRESGVNTVSISVESTVPEIHDSLRGVGTFEKAIRGIRLLRENAPSIKISINFVITPENFRNMSEMIPFAEMLGVHQVKFAPLHTNLQHKKKHWEDFPYLIFKEKDLDDLEDEVRRLIHRAKKSKLYTTSMRFLDGVTSLYRSPHKFRCYAGYATCIINSVGMIAPCCDTEGIISVRDKPLEEIWRKDLEFHKRRQVVRNCNRACWDTTNTEISLHLMPSYLLMELIQIWRDLKFYFGNKDS